MPRSWLLLDACVAINLAATDRFHHITGVLDVTFVMARQAAAETGYLRDFIRGELVNTPVRINEHADEGSVQVVDLDESEYPLYLELAAMVDDGEAATIAIAACRGLQLATDDRKARRLCAERLTREPLRTLALLHAYTDRARLEAPQIRRLLLMIRDRASYQPPRSDPDYKWWNDQMDST